MDRDRLISDILDLTPSTAAKRARSRPQLSVMSDARLQETHAEISGLIADGKQMLNELTPRDRAEFIALSRRPALAIDAAKVRLDGIRSRIKKHRAAALPGDGAV